MLLFRSVSMAALIEQLSKVCSSCFWCDWGSGLPVSLPSAPAARRDLRPAEDAAFGPCCLEITHGCALDPERSLGPKAPFALLETQAILPDGSGGPHA